MTLFTPCLDLFVFRTDRASLLPCLLPLIRLDPSIHPRGWVCIVRSLCGGLILMILMVPFLLVGLIVMWDPLVRENRLGNEVWGLGGPYQNL